MRNVEKYFNFRSHIYESAIRHNFIWETIKTKEKEIVLSLLSPQKNENILDAGSGPGIYAEILKDKGCRVICIDAASSMIRLVRQKGIEGYVLGIENFFFNLKFDKIICLGVLEFVSFPEKALCNLARHLKRDGCIVLIVPIRSIVGYSYKIIHYFHGIRIRMFSLNEIKLLLSKTGLEIERPVKLFGFSFVIKARPAERS